MQTRARERRLPVGSGQRAELRGADLPSRGSARPATLQQYCRSAGSRSETGQRPPPAASEEEPCTTSRSGEWARTFPVLPGRRPRGSLLGGGGAQSRVQRPAAPVRSLHVHDGLNIHSRRAEACRPTVSFRSDHANPRREPTAGDTTGHAQNPALSSTRTRPAHHKPLACAAATPARLYDAQAAGVGLLLQGRGCVLTPHARAGSRVWCPGVGCRRLIRVELSRGQVSARCPRAWPGARRPAPLGRRRGMQQRARAPRPRCHWRCGDRE